VPTWGGVKEKNGRQGGWTCSPFWKGVSGKACHDFDGSDGKGEGGQGRENAVAASLPEIASRVESREQTRIRSLEGSLETRENHGTSEGGGEGAE